MKVTYLRLYILLGIAVAAVASIGWILLSSSQKAEEENYTIGIVLPLTGAGTNWSLPYLDGMELAVKSINDNGGINGKLLRTAVEDGRLETSHSATAVRFLLLIEDPDVFIVIFAVPAMAAGPLLEQAGKPWIYEAYSRSQLEYSTAFKGSFDAESGCEKLARYAKENGLYKKLGLLMSRTPYNEECANGIRKVESNLAEYWYEFGLQDFRSILARADKEGVDMLATIPIDIEILSMFRQISELLYPIKMLCAVASECIFDDVVKTARPETLNGSVSIDIVPPDFEETPFAKQYTKDHPDSTMIQLSMGALGYETGQYLAAAFKECEPGQSECLMESLENVTGYDSIFGTNGFKNHILNLETYLYEFQDGKWQSINEDK